MGPGPPGGEYSLRGTGLAGARCPRVPFGVDREEENRPDLENHLARLDRLAGSLPEGHNVRLLIESAVGSARARDARKAGSDVSRSRSAVEGRISTLQGTIGSLDA